MLDPNRTERLSDRREERQMFAVRIEMDVPVLTMGPDRARSRG
jgi:hypothetical protein